MRVFVKTDYGKETFHFDKKEYVANNRFPFDPLDEAPVVLEVSQSQLGRLICELQSQFGGVTFRRWLGKTPYITILNGHQE